MKRFRVTNNVGKVKYLVSFHDGNKKHKDGSDFFDIQCFSNKIKMASFVNDLLRNGYITNN